ncbi:hypothetical protein T492DRAFT_135498 [Pavlovales sp. CCMP2436]|nr:hypothetical protein T492DRAFT_135498 [Pavlovales sp. CCMP2436]
MLSPAAAPDVEAEVELPSSELPTSDLPTHTLGLRDVYRLRGILTVAVIEAIVLSVLSNCYLPYARSIQHCNSAPTPEQLQDVYARTWSGSRFCANRDYVTSEAQSLVNIGSGATLALCCIVLPSYGVLADRIGRWRVMQIYYFGISCVCVAFAIFPNNLVFVLLRGLSGVLGDPHPIAHAQIADVCSPEVRSSCFAFVLVVKMTVGSLAGLSANFLIVGRHIYDYTYVWLALAVGCFLLFSACFLFPETHPNFRRRNSAITRGKAPPAEPAAAHFSGLGLYVYYYYYYY